MPDRTSTQFDTLGFIMQIDRDDCSDAELIAGMQHLIDNGMAWRLQGSYGCIASDLIAMGHCRPAGKELH